MSFCAKIVNKSDTLTCKQKKHIPELKQCINDFSSSKNKDSLSNDLTADICLDV